MRYNREEKLINKLKPQAKGQIMVWQIAATYCSKNICPEMFTQVINSQKRRVNS